MKSNNWGVFLMKLTYGAKRKIYELRRNRISWSQIGEVYNVRLLNFKYMVNLMDGHGAEIVRKSKKRYYFLRLK